MTTSKHGSIQKKGHCVNVSEAVFDGGRRHACDDATLVVNN